MMSDLILLIFVFVVVVLMLGFGLMLAWMEYRHKEKRAKATGQQDEFSERLSRIEQRMNNLETIIIERDRHKAFDAAL